MAVRHHRATVYRFEIIAKRKFKARGNQTTLLTEDARARLHTCHIKVEDGEPVFIFS